MSFFPRATRKAKHFYQKYLLDGVLAEWLAPTVLPWVFPQQKRSVPAPDQVRSVLLWNADSFGDFLFTTPLLQSLRLGYPEAKIHLALNAACIALAETSPHVDELIPLPAKLFYDGGGLFQLPLKLRNLRPDVMLIAEMGVRPADAARVIARRLGAGYIVSSNLGLLKTLADFTLPANTNQYWPAYFLRLAQHLGLPTGSVKPEVCLTPEDEAEAAKVLSLVTHERLVGLHPMVAPYAMLTKKWPDESFRELARKLHQQTATRFIITGSADEASACELLVEQLRQDGLTATSAAGKLGLRGTVALFKKLNLVVTGDTAALHLATVAGVPTVALFGATDERLLTAPGIQACAIELPCRPCHKVSDRRPGWPKCHYDRPWCLHRLTPAQVNRTILELPLVNP